MKHLKYLTFILLCGFLFLGGDSLGAKQNNYAVKSISAYTPKKSHSKNSHKNYQKKSQKSISYRSNRGVNYLNRTWDKGTFSHPLASVQYHTGKHGNGRTPLQYTNDAMSFYKKNQDKKRVVTRHDQKVIKIQNGKKGGYWTKNGKLLTYWD